MRLTRRDAVVSLAVGAGAGAVGLADLVKGSHGDASHPDGFDETHLRTLVAVAEVVYPSEVSGIETFVREYASGLPRGRKPAIATAVEGLETYTRREWGAAFARLSVADRDSVLRSLGLDRTGSSPEGHLPDRVRYYVVNQLLYGLYTSPTGSKLVGIENPVGYPGGHQSYQKPPTAGAKPGSHDQLGADPNDE